jgi:Lar family restriction alleviation protein
MEDSSLKACPFCGGAAEMTATAYDHEYGPQNFERIEVWVCHCSSCAAYGQSSTASDEDAIAEWNRRTDPVREAPVEALEKIENHWACQYDHPRKQGEMYAGPYGIGITDGHRAAALIATAALSLAKGKP